MGVDAVMSDYVTRTELQRMVDACDPSTLAGKRDRLLLVVLRALGGRSGEAVNLRMSDVEIHEGVGIALMVQSPRDPDQEIAVMVPTGEFTDHDSMRLFCDWKGHVANQASLIRYYRYDGGPLFWSVTKDGTLRNSNGLTPTAVNLIVKRAAARAGLDHPERFNARIMRGPVRRKVAR